MNLKVYEIAYDETLTVDGTVAAQIVSYDVIFSDQGPQGIQGIQGIQGPTGTSALTNQGDILYRNATVPDRLPIGTAGQFLKVNTGATAPEWATITKSTVGLGNVDNTSDSNKPVSTATQAALDGKASSAAAVPSGGTTGQVLRKKTNSNYDTEWGTESGGVPTSRTISAGTGLTGGGDLSADRTLAVSYGSSTPNSLGTASSGSSNTASRSDHIHAMPEIQNVTGAGGLFYKVDVTSGSYSGTLLYIGQSNGRAQWSANDVDQTTLDWDGTKWRLYPGVTAGAFIFYTSTDNDVHNASWTAVQGAAPTPTLTFYFINGNSFAEASHATNHTVSGNDAIFDQDLNTTNDVTFGTVTLYNGDLIVGDLGGFGGISGFGRTIDFEQNIISGFNIPIAPQGDDIEITDATKGVILKSPDSSRWRITIDNDGNLSSTKL